MDDPSNLFIISSDFCHWGRRFNFTFHDKRHGPIHKSIEELDKAGMTLIERHDPQAFTQYLRDFENTICGRHPIAVLLNVVKTCQSTLETRFVQYEQSSLCNTINDSSVS